MVLHAEGPLLPPAHRRGPRIDHRNRVEHCHRHQHVPGLEGRAERGRVGLGQHVERVGVEGIESAPLGQSVAPGPIALPEDPTQIGPIDRAQCLRDGEPADLRAVGVAFHEEVVDGHAAQGISGQLSALGFQVVDPTIGGDLQIVVGLRPGSTRRRSSSRSSLNSP